VDGAVEQLQEDLKWLGIEFDEGPSNNGSYGPYIQSERLENYQYKLNVIFFNLYYSYWHCFKEKNTAIVKYWTCLQMLLYREKIRAFKKRCITY